MTGDVQDQTHAEKVRHLPIASTMRVQPILAFGAGTVITGSQDLGNPMAVEPLVVCGGLGQV